MRRLIAILLPAALLVLAGCAPKSANNASATGGSDTTATPALPMATVAHSLYDDGPRAAASPVDAASAAAGAKLFATRGCTACHAYGKKLTGPDLKGVSTRRTAAWLEHQIMAPDVMTRTDSISHALMVENHNLQMLNLHLTQAEARSLIEYFKKLDAGR